MLAGRLRTHVGHLFRSGRESSLATPHAMFRALYGADPTEPEAAILGELAAIATEGPAATARHVIARFDRQVRPTPFSVRFAREDVQFVPVHGYEMAVDRADPSVSGPLRASGTYEPHLTRFFERHLRPGMTAVDVGANVGYHTLLAARLVGPGGRVLAFEPNSENCRLVLLSLHRNALEQVTLYPVGLSSCAGAAYFSPHLGSNGGFLPSAESTLLDPNCVVVPTMRLDDLPDAAGVNFLKIDTEGAEGLVLAGARGLLARDRPVVTTEFSVEMLNRVSRISGRDYLEAFRALGYQIARIDRATANLEPIDDLGAFLDGYSLQRIEDLAFLPASGPNATA